MDATHGQITEMEIINSVNGSGNTVKQIKKIIF